MSIVDISRSTLVELKQLVEASLPIVAGGEKGMPNGEEIGVGAGPQRNTLAAIAAGVLVVAAGFLVYNYFSRAGREAEPEITEEAAIFEEGEITIPEPGEIAGEEEEEEEGLVVREEAEAGEELPEVAPTVAGAWTARDLTPDSITEDSYTVQSGDTLWEIAEARYGSGFEWGKILEANEDSIGFLPNGCQVLIVPGQTLVLP